MSKKPTLELNNAPADEDVSRKVESAEGVVVVHGMRLKLRKPRAIAQLRLISLVGSEDAKNQVYMSLVSPLLWIEAIDDEPLGMFASKREMEAMFERIGEEGIVAISEHVAPQVSTDKKKAEAEAKN